MNIIISNHLKIVCFFHKKCVNLLLILNEFFGIDMTAKRIIFTGRVQGVGFRFTAHSVARHCRLKGFIRNLPDGNVEMLAQGQAEDIDNCLSLIKETFADCIRDIQLEDIEPDNKYEDFRITF